MNRERHVPEEDACKVPGYIVTYSDMVTLLLTFFVMLLTLSTVQDPELFNVGRDSFVESMRNLGLGILLGGVEKPNFGHVKVKYFISEPDRGFDGRTIDATEEEIRRIFKKVSRSMKAMRSQIVAEKNNFSVTGIHFAQGDSSLDETAKRFLTDFCGGLEQEPDSKAVSLYVLGLADDEPSEMKQWTLSAKRAAAAADFLREVSESKWPVYSWGAGPGGDWVKRDGPISTESQVSIAVLRSD